MFNSNLLEKKRAHNNECRLANRHYSQIASAVHDVDLSNVMAVTFSPADRSYGFQGRTLARIGSTVLVAARYEANPCCLSGFSMPLTGVRGRAFVDGTVRYGAEGDQVFNYDGSLSPITCANGNVLDRQRNAALIERLLQMDQTCKKLVRKYPRLRSVPKLPRIWLGFNPAEPPPFEDSPSLRQRAAKILGISARRLGTNGNSILRRFLEDVWDRELVWPGTANNPTGHLFVDAELCTNARTSLSVYEDLTDLVGVYIWNPVREVKLSTAPNPARDVLRRFNIDTSQDFSQHLPDQLIEHLEIAMREHVGPRHHHFTQEEIFDGLTSPEEPLTAYSSALPRLRSKLPLYFSDCSTDDDLLKAARNPADALFASGAARVQVIQLPEDASLHFNEALLRRRIELELGGAKCY